jgi:hypothetical protein
VADLCTCGSGSPRNLDHTLSCPHSRPWSERAKAQQELDAADATHPRHVAYEFFNPATGHAIVDYSEFTHVGRLTAERGYLKLPLVYADAMQAGDAPSDMDYGNGMNVSAGDAGAVLSDEQIQATVFAVLRKWKDDRAWDRYTRETGPYDVTELRAEVLEIIRAVLASAPKAAVPEVERDAARYRHLRSRDNSLEAVQRDKGTLNGASCYHMVGGVRELKSGAELDEAVDAAMHPTTEKE